MLVKSYRMAANQTNPTLRHVLAFALADPPAYDVYRGRDLDIRWIVITNLLSHRSARS